MVDNETSSSSSSVAELSDYERTRAVNIERNNAKLRSLGLITAEEERRSNDKAWKRRSTTTIGHSSTKGHSNSTAGDEDESSKSKRKRPIKTSPTVPSRKSLRVQGKDPEGAPLPDDDNDDENLLESKRQRRVEECRQARQLAALRYAQLTDAEKKAAQENPTATYEHCLKRVRTMTEKALYNRVRAIERATGKHCVIKMVRVCVLAFGCSSSCLDRFLYVCACGRGFFIS